MPAVPCAANPETFHSTAPAARTEAKKSCYGCHARIECLKQALAGDERHGVWGGLDPNERWQVTHKDGTWLDYRGTVRAACGPESSLKKHRTLRETCTVCEQAHAERTAADRRQWLAEEHAKGGTARGFTLHHQLGENACGPCSTAQQAASAAGRAARRTQLAAAS
jgi:hypothetical protein